MAVYVSDEPFVAEEAMSKYSAVTTGTSGEGFCELVDATTDRVLGFVQETVVAADAGERVVNVRTAGVSYAIAAATISAGDELKVTATGTLTPVTTAGDIICAEARDDAAAGDWFNVLIKHSVKHV